jgi:hypothetical protein
MSVFDTISVYANVEIELDDIKDDVLRKCSIEELVDALANKEVNWDVTNNPDYHVLKKLYFSPDDLYRHLCDVAGVGYHEPKESLLNKIKDLM